MRELLGRIRAARWPLFVAAWAGATGLVFQGPGARADAPPMAASGDSPARPPPPRRPYAQYGVAVIVETVPSAGSICADAKNPCILGSGAGIAVRAGWRPTEDLYLGLAYELSKQDPSNLYRLAILQQGRLEARHYFPTGRSAEPFVILGAGLAGYGNEWSVDTWGPSAALGAGIEWELAGQALLSIALVYRPIYLRSFSDSSALSHGAGIAQFAALEIALEAEDAL